MFKNAIQGEEGRKKIKIGVDTIADAIKVTLGPKGKNVLIGSGYGPVHISKDGWTVARSITLVEPIENLGCTLIKEIAGKTVAEAGDATTTSMVLGQAIIDAGLKAMEEGANSMELKKGIDRAVEKVVLRLKEISKKVDSAETLVQIATISANNDAEMGKLIADAFTEVGPEGEINVTDSKTHETYVDIVNGMKIERGFHSPIFINTDKRRTCEFEDPLILVTDRKVSTIAELLPFFENVLKQHPTKPILLILDRLEGEALSFIYKNTYDKKLNVCVILAPEFNDDRKRALEDIAILTGATFISDEQGMTIAKAGVKQLGAAEKVIIDEHSTLFIGGQGNSLDIETRCEELRAGIEEGNEVVATKLKSRLAKLRGKIASIKVGAITPTEAIEKKDRIDDALCATRAANEEGFVVGGGNAFLHCLPKEEITDKGEAIIYEAIQKPFKQILMNAGLDYNDALDKALHCEYGEGFNAKTEEWGNLLEEGVIDPTKCCRCALENAASIASIFLTTECVISDPKPKDY